MFQNPRAKAVLTALLSNGTLSQKHNLQGSGPGNKALRDGTGQMDRSCICGIQRAFAMIYITLIAVTRKEPCEPDAT